MLNQDNRQDDDWGVSADSPNQQYQSILKITKENKLIYQVAVWALAITTVFSIAAVSILAFFGKESPSALVAIGSISAGALASLFTRNS